MPKNNTDVYIANLKAIFMEWKSFICPVFIVLFFVFISIDNTIYESKVVKVQVHAIYSESTLIGERLYAKVNKNGEHILNTVLLPRGVNVTTKQHLDVLEKKSFFMKRVNYEFIPIQSEK